MTDSKKEIKKKEDSIPAVIDNDDRQAYHLIAIHHVGEPVVISTPDFEKIKDFILNEIFRSEIRPQHLFVFYGRRLMLSPTVPAIKVENADGEEVTLVDELDMTFDGN